MRPEGVQECPVNLGVTDAFREINGLDEGRIVGGVTLRLVHSLNGSDGTNLYLYKVPINSTWLQFFF